MYLVEAKICNQSRTLGGTCQGTHNPMTKFLRRYCEMHVDARVDLLEVWARGAVLSADSFHLIVCTHTAVWDQVDGFSRQKMLVNFPDIGCRVSSFGVWHCRQRVATEQSRCQSAKAELETERDKRVYYEALVLRKRSEREGVRPDSNFPSVHAVVQDVKHRLVNDALTWSETVSALCESQPDLPATIRAVLEHTFNVCREEATRCLGERLGAFKQCLGKDEPISLSGDIPMNLDTEYVLYECLRRNYQTIVSMKPHRMKNLAATIVQRCGRHENLAGAITSNNAWLSFNVLMEHYLQVFVAVSGSARRSSVLLVRT